MNYAEAELTPTTATSNTDMEKQPMSKVISINSRRDPRPDALEWLDREIGFAYGDYGWRDSIGVLIDCMFPAGFENETTKELERAADLIARARYGDRAANAECDQIIYGTTKETCTASVRPRLV